MKKKDTNPDTPAEHLINAMTVLKEYITNPEHTSGPVIHGDEQLGKDAIEILMENGCLWEVMDGWYIMCHNVEEEDRADWFRAYWPFIVAYLDDKLGGEWALSPDCSLDLYSGETLVPEHLVVRSPRAEGEITRLPFGTTLYELQGDIPGEIVKEPAHGVHLYPLTDALLNASEGYFNERDLEAQVCLAMLTDAEPVIRAAVEDGYHRRAMLLAAGLRCIGRPDMADRIVDAVNEYLAGARDLFDARSEKPIRLKDTSPVANRIRLMWRSLRGAVLSAEEYADCKPFPHYVHRFAARIPDIYDREDLAGLGMARYASVEDQPRLASAPAGAAEDGTATTPEEIMKKFEAESLLRRGFSEAFRKVTRDILDSMSGGRPMANLCALHFREWNYLLFRPGVKEKAFSGADHLSDRLRRQDTVITGSRHIPFDPDDMTEALRALSEVMQREEDALVRAVLGHFFIMYIQPFTAGNAQTAWFVTNSQLVAGGYPWITLDKVNGEQYTTALRRAVDEEYVDDFVDMMTELIYSARKEAGQIVRKRKA